MRSGNGFQRFGWLDIYGLFSSLMSTFKKSCSSVTCATSELSLKPSIHLLTFLTIRAYHISPLIVGLGSIID